MQFIVYKAHVNDETGAVQTVCEHCLQTASLAEEYAVSSLKDITYVMGLLHDIGKYQGSFQKKIDGAVLSVEHSVCGAIEAKSKYKSAVLSIIQYCVAGHHSGIPDGGNRCDAKDVSTLQGRLKRSFEDYSAYKNELDIPDIDENILNVFFPECKSKDDKDEIIERFAFLTRYCFSCLVDADSNDTARFCRGVENEEMRSDFKKCLKHLDNKLSSFSCMTKLQKARAGLQKQAFDKVSTDAEIYFMSMPTGSGKTLCSMKFALERAIRTGKRRIIYVIPYNSIIDQTAEEFEKLFGEDAHILRHQSTFSYDGENSGGKIVDEDYREIIREASENWNAQIVITTAVQFFETVYSNKRKKLRKMHNMAESVIVFDEAHLMPTEYLQPCLKAISYITRFLGSEALFLTATMPDYEGLIRRYSMPDCKMFELIEDKSEFSKFRKCKYTYINEISAAELVIKAQEYPSSLVVVNRRKTAREIYRLCKGKKFHLSTYMTAFDRKNVIDEIKGELAALARDFPDMQNVPDDRKITVVSTSLIEAGVDLDFYCAFRELYGLDSVLQTGGRCNREGKFDDAQVFVFSLDSQRNKVYSDEKPDLTKGLFSEFDDISSEECIGEYYNRFFRVNSELITKNSLTKKYNIPNVISIPFSEYSDGFELIKNENCVSIAVVRDEISENLIAKLIATGNTNYRALQKYAFSVYISELEELRKQNAVKQYGGVWCLVSRDYYDENIGVRFEASDYII